MNTEDLSDTIAPKSDQLNADDLLAGPITVTIENVSRGSRDQPISISIPPHQPFKPCKSMRRVLVSIWGKNGKEWIGKSLTLYCDTKVTFGGVAVGGIRISHASHIDNNHTMMLTTAKAKKSSFTVKTLIIEQQPQVDLEQLKLDAETAAAGGISDLEEWFLALDKPSQKAIKPDLDGYKQKAANNS